MILAEQTPKPQSNEPAVGRSKQVLSPPGRDPICRIRIFGSTSGAP